MPYNHFHRLALTSIAVQQAKDPQAKDPGGSCEIRVGTTLKGEDGVSKRDAVGWYVWVRRYDEANHCQELKV